MSATPTRSTGELIADAVEDFIKLLRKELELARIGLVESLAARAKGAALIALGVLAILPGLLFLVIALALALPFSAQTGFAIVGVVLLAAAGIGVWLGIRKLRRGSKEGNEALAKVKEDARWARGRLRR